MSKRRTDNPTHQPPAETVDYHGTYTKKKIAKTVAKRYENGEVARITKGQNKGNYTVITRPSVSDALEGQ
jgi:hypothetical protein